MHKFNDTSVYFVPAVVWYDNIEEKCNFVLPLFRETESHGVSEKQTSSILPDFPQRHWNIELVPSKVSLTSWGEGASLALVDHPSSDSITIKIPYVVDILLYRPASHPIFSSIVNEAIPNKPIF